MNFYLPLKLAALRDRVRTFIREQVLPHELDPRCGTRGPDESLRLVSPACQAAAEASK